MQNTANNGLCSGQVTMAEVARAAGVSRSTASLALSGRRAVSAAAKARVIKMARQLNYFPNQAARGLRAGKTRTIGLLIRDMYDQWAPVLIEEIKAAAAELGFHISLMFASPTLDQRGETYLRGLSDGAIIHASPIPDDICRMIDEGFPAAELMAGDAHPGLIAGTRFSQAAAYTRMLDQLLCLGHRRFGFIWLGKDEMFSLATDYLKDKGVPFDATQVIEGVRKREEGELAFLELHRRCPEITALIAYNDMVAVGAMRAAREVGLRVPEDLSVVGNGDTELGRIWSPRLTTLQYPIREMCRQTVRRLVDRVNGVTLFPPGRMEAELLIRESIAPARER